MILNPSQCSDTTKILQNGWITISVLIGGTWGTVYKSEFIYKAASSTNQRGHLTNSDEHVESLILRSWPLYEIRQFP